MDRRGKRRGGKERGSKLVERIEEGRDGKRDRNVKEGKQKNRRNG